MRIDVHGHYFPRAYIEVATAAYARPANNVEEGIHRILTTKVGVDPKMYDLDARLEDMTRAGVDLMVLSVSIPQTYHADRATAVAMAQAANDGTAEACRRYLVEQPDGPIRPPPWVTGNDLIAMGWKPGPEFKRLLEEVYDAQLEGRVPNRDEALAWLQRRRGEASQAPRLPTP